MHAGQAGRRLSPEEVEDLILEGCPADYICPLSLVLMTAPVAAEDGLLYQREALEEHFAWARQSEWLFQGVR